MPAKYFSQAGNIDVVKSLVRAGAKVDARDTYGLTALHKVACKTRQTSLLRGGGKGRPSFFLYQDLTVQSEINKKSIWRGDSIFKGSQEE